MGEGKHTPEPWFWARDKHDQPTSLMRSGTGDYVISAQADVTDYGLSVNPWMDISKDDECLIAAAPELLEVAQALKELFRFALLSMTPDIAKDGMEFIRKAEAAIAKATGEQSS